MLRVIDFLVDSFSRITGFKTLNDEEQRDLTNIQRGLSTVSLEMLLRIDQVTKGKICSIKIKVIGITLSLLHYLAQCHLRSMIRRYLRSPIPWTAGYILYKDEELDRIITEDAKVLESATFFGKGLDERIVELPWVVKKIQGSPLVLDAGSALNHEVVLKHLSDSKIYITTLYPESYRSNSGVSYVYEDLRALSFRNGFFDSVVSVSTIEHIGLDTQGYKNGADLKDIDKEQGDHLTAILEMKRVVRPGGQVLITAPFGKHEIYRNQWQVFNAEMVERVVEVFCPASYEVYYYRYTDQHWHSATAEDCVESLYHGHDSPGAGAVFLLQLVK